MNNNCIECPIGKFKGNTGSPFSCVDICPGNNYLDTDTCKPCDPTCGSCQGPAATQCITSCSGTLKRSSTAATFSCVVLCPGGTYDDAGTCMPCDSSCATCGGPLDNECITCQSNLQYSGGGPTYTCVSGCLPGQYNNSGTCAACHPTCKNCLGSSSA